MSAVMNAYLDSQDLSLLVAIGREDRRLLKMLAAMDAFATAGLEYLNGPRPDAALALHVAVRSTEIAQLIGQRLDSNTHEANRLLGIEDGPAETPLEALRRAWEASKADAKPA